MQYNAKYSNKDFTGHDLSGNTDMSGITIYNSCFSHETPNAQILPSNLIGTTFVSCNLDNVFIPSGNALTNSSNRLFKAQNDGNDWQINAQLQPTQPLNMATAIATGENTNPALIPAQSVSAGIA